MATERQGFHGPATFEGKSQSGTSSDRSGWFDETITKIPEAGQVLLEEYSGILSADVLAHVTSIRDRAFAVWNYACIGQVRFLNYSLGKQPYYEPVMKRLRDGGKFLDAGCCFGQELRFLKHREGIDGEQLYGFDLEPGFVDFGYELFRDRERLGATLFSGDLLASPTSPAGHSLTSIENQMDVVHCSSVLHVWGWDQMLIAAKRLVSLTKPIPGSLIVGTQMGSRNPGEYPMPTAQGFNYRHNEESMEKFWGQVGKETGTRWKVESGMFVTAAVTENLKHSWAKADPGIGMIWFMVERL